MKKQTIGFAAKNIKPVLFFSCSRDSGLYTRLDLFYFISDYHGWHTGCPVTPQPNRSVVSRKKCRESFRERYHPSQFLQSFVFLRHLHRCRAGSTVPLVLGTSAGCGCRTCSQRCRQPADVLGAAFKQVL